jgi:hypothetical protein
MGLASKFAWVAAVLFGALVPAAIGVREDIGLLPIAFRITLSHALFLGLPVALWYRRIEQTGLWASLAGGFAIGMGPAGLFALASNSLTWLELLEVLAVSGGLGASGALAFWLTLRVTGNLDLDGPPMRLSVLRGAWSAAGLAGSAVIASSVVFAIPIIIKDRSCHNIFRDGRTSIGPTVTIDLDISATDRPKLTSVIEEFGKEHEMAFRNWSDDYPSDYGDDFQISLCNEEGLVIEASDDRGTDRGFPITIFVLSAETAWQTQMHDLIVALDAQWPEKVRYRDRVGKLVEEPVINSEPGE